MTISCAGHALALGFAVVAISASPMNAPPVEAITTQIVSVKDFSQMTKGVKNAPQLKIPDLKPLADKVGEEKSVDQIAPKVAEKPPITTDAKSDPPPKPDTPKPDPKTAKADPKPPDPKPEQKPDPKPADKPKPLEYKPDQIASLLKKDAAKDQQKQPKFDANQVAQLLDQRTPQRQLASAAALNNNAGYGSATAEQSAQLSQSAQAAFVRKVQSCMIWPPGTDTSTNITVNIEVLLNRDGTLAGAPQTIAPAPISALGPALAESAKRALIKCQPYTMFKDEPYDQWRDLAPAFNPSILMNGG